MDKYISGFIIKNLRYSLKIAIISVVLLFINTNYFIAYFLGYLLGIFNFILLSIGTNILVTLRPKRIKLIHFLFFTLRISFVAYILAKAAVDGHNIFILFLGFITMNISIKLNGLYEARREV